MFPIPSNWKRLFAKLFGVAVLAVASVANAATRPNVIFIVSDDLNNDLGCYGHPVVKSPNIDRLAKHGVRFDRAYVQYPVCNPSRTSFLSGKRPDTMRVHDLFTPPRTFLKDTVFLPQYFRQQGYATLKVGKIFHTGDDFEDSASWDKDIRETKEAKNPPKGQLGGKQGPGVILNAPDDETYDGRVARQSVEVLEKAVKDNKPFFLATGFRRPHTPYIAPQKYFDLYPVDQMKPRPETAAHLKDIPPLAFTYVPEEKQMTEKTRREIMAAYYSSITFMDAQLGLVLDAVDRHKLWENTVVIFFSDHGYHLGEHGGLWHKMSLFEESARVPLLIAAPGRKSNASSPRLVELIDVYPTLVELCGLPMPKDLEGRSMVPLLDNPALPWKQAAFTQVVRASKPMDNPGTLHVREAKDLIMGYTVRTERWRYIEWDSGKQGTQLYDHDNDPREFVNLAKDPKHAETVKELKQLLQGQRHPLYGNATK